MKPFDDEGRELNSIYAMQAAADNIYLILESRGGATGGQPPRNEDYSIAFATLLRRLGQLSATLTDIEVYSNVTRDLTIEERRVSTPSFPLPLDLTNLSDIEQFRHEVGRASAALGRQPGAIGGGNPTKRLRLTLRWPKALGRTSAELEELLARKVTAQSDLPEASVAEQPTADPNMLSRRADRARSRLRRARVVPVPPAGSAKVAQTETSTRRFVRDPEVVAWVLFEANGICEMCAQPAPFSDPSGEPFLEVHHVRPLAEGGPDQTENAVAVCPNCHRRLHFGADKDQIRLKLIEKLERLRDYPQQMGGIAPAQAETP